jgi:hypothetical protein
MSPHSAPDVGTIVIGAGPAGFALLIAAKRAGVLGDLIADGLLVVDPCERRRLGTGSLGDYGVRSDTSGRVFVESATALLGSEVTEPRAAALLAQCDTDGPVPLRAAAELLSVAGASVASDLISSRGEVALRGKALAITPRGDHQEVLVRLRDRDVRLTARSVVIATGGVPAVPPWLTGSRLAGELVHSDSLIRGGLPRRFAGRTGPRSPRIIVVGGSHSAFSATGVLLGLDPDKKWPEATVNIAHRSPIKITYADVRAATTAGLEVHPEDVCPQTGRVHRFGGLRTDSADLWRAVTSTDEPRARLTRLDVDLLRSADLVVAATGYSSPAGALLGRPVGAFDGQGKLRDVADRVVPGIYGVGLGAARKRDGRTGGEPSYRGSIDGVWFYQQIVAPTVLEELLASPRR